MSRKKPTDPTNGNGGNGDGGNGDHGGWPKFDGFIDADSDTYNDGNDGVDIDVDIDKDIDIDHDVVIDDYELDLTLDLQLDVKLVTTRVDRDVDLDYKVNVVYDQVIDGPVTIIEDTQIIDEQDNDGNDIDNYNLIDVSGDFSMDDFSLDNLATNWSFNGSGNDGLTDVNQTNNNYQDNWLGNPTVNFNGPGAETTAFQDVYIKGGTARADDGIDGTLNGKDIASGNDGDGIIEGLSQATATIDVDISLFTQDLTQGANQQQNIFSLDQVSGDSTDLSDSSVAPKVQYNEPNTKTADHPDDWTDDNPDPKDPPEVTSDAGMLLVEDSHFLTVTDNDGNDIDTQDVLNVGEWGWASLDDIEISNTGINGSFNGAGNDWQTNVSQSNDLKNINDIVNPSVSYTGTAPYKAPFQNVLIEGGSATADDGIDTDDQNIGGSNYASYNDGDGIMSGVSEANVDVTANIEAFTQDITQGGNLQVNSATINLVGGNSLTAEGVYGNPYNATPDYADDSNGTEPVHSSDGGAGWLGDVAQGQHVTDIDDVIIARATDDDGNDIDNADFIDVSGWAEMDDFTADNVAHNGSFNGSGNDNGFDIDQVNDLVNSNFISNPSVGYSPSGGTWEAFQEVDIYGGVANNPEGQGIKGDITTDGLASYNGGDGIVSGQSIASADVNADVAAFTQNIVMGANIQGNVANMTVVGGNATSFDDVDYDG